MTARPHAASPPARRLAIALIVALALAATTTAPARAQEPLNRAGVVIQYGDGEVQTACVRFPEAEISGLELVQRAGVPVVAQVSGMGAAVCKIGRDGCDYPGESCFCQRDGPRALYWAYYLREGEGWRYSTQSAGAVRVADGAVQGWAWGLDESGSGAVPPLLDIDALCGSPVEAAGPAASPGSPATAPAPAAAEASAPAASAEPSPPADTASPAPATPAEAAPGAGQGWAGYAGFALIALLLIGGVALARRR